MKKKKGSSMVYVLLITASVMLVGTTCLTSLAMGLKATIEENKRTQSLYGADAGVEWAKSLLMKTFQTATEYAEAVVKEKCDSDSTEAQLNEAFKIAFIDFIGTTSDNNEFHKALESGSYIASIDKKSIKSVPFSHETETAPIFEIDENKSKLNDEKTEYRIDLTSIYGETTNGIRNDREISVTFNILIPEFQGQYSQRVDVYPVYNDKVIAIDGDLNINQSDVIVSEGDIYVGGNPIKELAQSNASYAKYIGGIQLNQSTLNMGNETNDNEISNNIITANTINLVSDSKLEGANLYARNLYLGSTDPGSYNNGDSSIQNNEVNLDEVVLDNDLAIKSIDSEVEIKKFYGINDKTYKTAQLNTETGDITEVSQTSSSIIVNEQSSTLSIEEECYIMGVAYIDTVGKKYETGESIAVKGNYVAYTQPLEIFNDFEFSYYEPLYLVDKKIEAGKYVSLDTFDKSDYFYEFAKQQANQLNTTDPKVEMKESNTVLSSGGTQLPDNDKIFTVGAIVYRKDDNLVVEKGGNYTEGGNYSEVGEVIKNKQSDFANKVYNLGRESGTSLNTYGSDDRLKVSDVIDFELLKSRCLSNVEKCQKNGLFIDISMDYSNPVNESSRSTINLNNELGSKFTGVIITDGNIIVDDDFQLDGILITSGNVEIKTKANNTGKTDQKVNILLNYDKNLVQTIISRNFELLDGVFKGEKLKPEEVNGFLEYNPNNYNPMNFISTENWNLIR